MQFGANRMRNGQASVAIIALEIGYDSEAAFSRAFKHANGQRETRVGELRGCPLLIERITSFA